MNTVRTMTLFVDARRHRWHGAVMALAATAIISATPPARAQGPILPTIVSDFAAASDDARDEAAAVSLLVRSMLKPLRRQFVSRRELTVNLEKIGSKDQRDLSVSADNAVALLQKSLADRLSLGVVGKKADRLFATGKILDGKGKTIRDIDAMAPLGAIDMLSRQVAQQIAGATESDLADITGVTMHHLRPFAAASALVRTDPAKAARALQIAAPGVGTKVGALKELGQAIWLHPSVKAEDRLVAALAVGDAQAARTFADKVLKESPSDVAARAGRIRALVDLEDFKGAEKELRELKKSAAAAATPEVAVASASYAVAIGAPVEERDAAFAPLLNQPSAKWGPALAYVASTEPRSFGDKVEGAALAKAEEIKLLNPSMATSIGIRAVTGDFESERGVALIAPSDAGMDDIASIQQKVEKLSAGGSVPAQQLAAEFTKRGQIAQEIRLAAIGATDMGQHVALINALAPVLETFERLRQGGISSLTLVPMEGSGQAFYSPYKVRVEGLRMGLGVALAGPPYSFQVRPAPAEQEPVREAQLSEDGLANLASRVYADGVLLYKLRTSGGDAEISLILVDAKTRKAWRAAGSINGRATGLLVLNHTPVIVIGVLLLVGVGFLVRHLLAGGIVVQLKEDPDAKEPVLCVRISRQSAAPQLGNPVNFLERMRRVSASVNRYEAFRIGARTAMNGLQRGKWFVHVYGVYKRGTDLVGIEGESFTRQVVVKAGRTVMVHFNMEATHAQFILTVTDSDVPVGGAKIWIDNDHANQYRTAPDGKASFDVPRGKHIINIAAKELVIERPFDVLQTKVHEVPINLEWERRRDGVSRVFEKPGDRRPSSVSAPAVTESDARMAAAEAPPNSVSIFASSPAAGGGRANPFATSSPANANPFAGTPRIAGGKGAFAPSPEIMAGAAGTPRLPNNTSPPPAGMSSVLGLSMGAGGTQTNTAGPPGVGPFAPRGAGGGGPATPVERPSTGEISIGNLAARPAAGPSSGAGLERYQRTAKLGAGAMGVVYRAQDVVLGREVALKIMSPDIRDNPEVAEKFQQEARALAALNHPNIVTVFDQGSASGELYMVMELVEGPGALDEILQKKTKLPPDEALEIIDQLCRGIGYAHKRRIIHRDIKPANMFITHDNMVKIGDFGLARAIQAMKITKTVVQGTPLYMSPEQILGRDVDFRADLYSIGCTFFELLTGQPPFIEGEVLYHHMHTPPPKVSSFDPSFPKALDDLIDKCLVKDQNSRIASAEDIRAGIKNVRAHIR